MLLPCPLRITSLESTINEEKQGRIELTKQLNDVNVSIGNLNGLINGLNKQPKSELENKSMVSDNSGSLGGH